LKATPCCSALWTTAQSLCVSLMALVLCSTKTGADLDFRIESDTNTHAFFLQGSDGNVGIGTSAPSSLLEIASNATSQTLPEIPTLRITNTDTTVIANDIVGSVEFFSKDASDPNVVTGFVRNIAQDAGVSYSLAFGTKAATIGSDATERMWITSSGDVGIGTSSPAAQLDVAATTGSVIRLTSTSTAVSADDPIGLLQFYGSDASAPGAGVKSKIAAYARAWTQGTVHT
jgi:hypothetical protein